MNKFKVYHVPEQTQRRVHFS